MPIKKNDFVEIEYSGKVKDGEVFDTNIDEEIKRLKLDLKAKPLVLCIGQNMILPAIDEFLIGKEPGKYTLELSAEKAFGERKREMIRTIPLSAFKNSQQPPYPGAVFAFDNMMGRVASVSSGRVIVDFNNPIAGKPVVYELRVLRIIIDKKEQVKALMVFIFGKELVFNIEDNKLILEADAGLKKFAEMFKDKFKEILNLDLEVKEKAEEKKAEKIKENSQNSI